MFEELSQHILDIAMNSLSANATKVQISILESRRRDRLVLRVRDDGCGMDAATLKRVLASRWSSKNANGANPSASGWPSCARLPRCATGDFKCGPSPAGARR
jgi:light-regulated signal transduction histidine kinase (bacteriophytochrome)